MSWPAANPTGRPPMRSRTRCQVCTRLRSAPCRSLGHHDVAGPREESSECRKVASAVPLGVSRRLGDDDDNTSDRNESGNDFPKSNSLTKKRVAIDSTMIGCNAPIVVAFTMVVVFTAVKNRTTSMPSEIPPAAECLRTLSVGLLPRRITRKIANEYTVNR